MGQPKAQAVNAPYGGTTSQTATNTFGYQSPDANDPNVKKFDETDVQVDPGAGRRGDLAEQSMQNRWNSAFNAAIPQTVREQNIGAETRQLRAETGAQQQQAAYAQNALELQKNAMRLPTLTQTGGATTGSQQGFQTSVVGGQQPTWAGLLSSAISGAATAAPFIP